MDLPVFTPAWWTDLRTENRVKYMQFNSVATVRKYTNGAKIDKSIPIYYRILLQSTTNVLKLI